MTAAPALPRLLPLPGAAAEPPGSPTAARPPAPCTAPQSTDGATQQRRRLQAAATLAGARVRATLVPDASVRRRQRHQLCSAARVLTALGVRVRVVQPPVPWPRTRPGRLLVADDIGWPGELAVLTAVPRTVAGWAALAERALPRHRLRAVPAEEPVGARAVLCPVAVTYRSASGHLDRAPRTLADVAAVSGLVVEVHLLRALEPGDAVPAVPA